MAGESAASEAQPHTCVALSWRCLDPNDDREFGQWICLCGAIGSGYRFRSEAEVANEWFDHAVRRNAPSAQANP